MENLSPPPPTETFPEPEAPKPKRWKLFELFRKNEEETAVVEKPLKQDAPAEHAPEKPTVTEPRRLAAGVLALLGGGLSQPEERQPVPVAAVEQLPVATSEVEPDQTFIVERARGIGRNVLKFVNRVKVEVAAADKREQVVSPTNMQPLLEADADVRAAMQELVAPIEAYGKKTQRAPEAAVDLGEVAVGQQELDAEVPVMAEGGEAVALLTEAPADRAVEIAAAVAEGTANEILDARERAQKRAGIVRKVGLFALGAATMGGFVYTWRRMRQIKHEQRALERKQEQFEIEVRAHQRAEELRLQQLGQTHVEQLTQPERQEYVQEVSDFAHAQADEIRTVARSQEAAQEIAGAPLPEASPPASRDVRQFALPVEKPSEAATFERPVIVSEESSSIERPTSFGAKKQEGGGLLGGVAAASKELVDAVKGSAPKTTRAASKAPTQQPPLQTQPTQIWLLGLMLAGGIGLVFFLIISM